jgi:DnaK suppressor protein
MTHSKLMNHLPELLIRLGDVREGARGRHELTEIQQAIDRMRDGSYGICEECEQIIQLERLRKIPQTRLCSDCQVEENRSRPVIRWSA